MPLDNSPTRFVILGGTGKIGTAVAAHLSHRISTLSSLQQQQQPIIPQCEIVLVGRKPLSSEGNNDDYFQGVLREIKHLLDLSSSDEDDVEITSSLVLPEITYECITDIWQPGALDHILRGSSNSSTTSSRSTNTPPPVSCVIHTAGPYADREGPIVLDACLKHNIPVYVDVSDPIDFLNESLERHDTAIDSGTTAILAAGAFPGMSNVLALEAAAKASTNEGKETENNNNDDEEVKIKDVRFNYFTKGLGGSGTINLYITNIGFGDPMVMYNQGKLTKFGDLSGRLLGTVDFFINEQKTNTNTAASWHKANARAKERVGTQKVFAWPFPECATVPSELGIIGASSSAMGTAPDLWNDMLGLLVDLVPRNWWRSKKFSKLLADFSEPLVLVTDFVMRNLSSKNGGDGNCGETHAMRVDVVTRKNNNDKSTDETMVSIVQCHDSFRWCVGQSCAEFALDAWLEYLQGQQSDDTTKKRKTGVYLPEQRYRDPADRKRILSRLTTTPGTFCYTGPVNVAFSRSSIQANKSSIKDSEADRTTKRQLLPVYPTQIRAIVQAMKNN